MGQGLAIPGVITWLGLAHAGRRERYRDRIHEFKARRAAIKAALGKLEQITLEGKLTEEERCWTRCAGCTANGCAM